MGRQATGIDYTTSAPRLDLSELLRVGFFTKGAKCAGTWHWSNGDRAEIVTYRHGAAVHMEVTTHFESYTGERHTVGQRIDLYRKPSNLGRGEVLYFICPRTGKLCRILYRAYHSHTWRSRKGFIHRLYYRQQAESGWARHPIREANVERKLERLHSRRIVATYRGKPTRRALRIAALEAKLERLTAAGWSLENWPPFVRRGLERGLLTPDDLGRIP